MINKPEWTNQMDLGGFGGWGGLESEHIVQKIYFLNKHS